VHFRLKRLAALVVPGIRRDVAAVDEHIRRGPVLRLARQPVAALEQQHALARRREMARERAAARAAADGNHDVGVAHPLSATRSDRMMRPAASISARWAK